MNSGKKLLEPECGQPNALVRVGQQFLQDASAGRARTFLGPLQPATRLEDEFAQEYLTEFGNVNRQQPTTFSMRGLLDEVNRLEPVTNVASAAAADWSREYLGAAAAVPSQDWTKEYLQGNSLAGPSANFDDAWQAASHAPHELKWSAEYLSDAESTQFADHGTSSLLSGIPDDAELWSTEFMQYMQTVDRGDTSLGSMQTAMGYDIDDSEINLARGESEKWDNFESEWDDVSKNSDSHQWLAEYDSLSSIYKDYNMSEQNPYLDADDPLALGKQLLDQGDLVNAVLCFEAAVQRQPQSSDGWLYLARTQAENEQETRAIAAANKCLELDAKNLGALAILATAYANESMYNSSCRTLANWLAAHPKYQSFAPVEIVGDQRRPIVSSFMDQKLFGSVETAFLEAAGSDLAVDPDLQNCFGVLYNLTGNTERAADCFQAALMIRPEDPRLWNRLGATLANGGRSAEAVAAYRRALNLYPGFVRSRYNLGISCQNLGAYREAIDHFLSALSLQMRGVGPGDQRLMSDAIWSTLRVAVMQTNNDAWLKLVDNRDFSGLKQVFGANAVQFGAMPSMAAQSANLEQFSS